MTQVKEDIVEEKIGKDLYSYQKGNFYIFVANSYVHYTKTRNSLSKLNYLNDLEMVDKFRYQVCRVMKLTSRNLVIII